MNIVVEGPDNSGKSTLASAISQSLGFSLVHSGGPERSPGELNNRAQHFLQMDSTVFDRHPCVSEKIYYILRDDTPRLGKTFIDRFYQNQPIIIYCDPADRHLEGHVIRPEEDPQHIRQVNETYPTILRAYRSWAMKHALLWYRIGDPPERIIQLLRTFDPVQDVLEFMEKFGQGYHGKPRPLPLDLSIFREDFMREELTEYVNHRQALQTPLHVQEWIGHLAEQLDALVDAVYVAIGTALLHGFDFREAWRRVHNANMKKERVAIANQSARHSLYDIRKPVGWVRPDHRDLIVKP